MTGRYSRNEGLFGAEGQAKIAATAVGIVGLGGLGSHVAQQLAYLGVRRFTLIDFDIVTNSSLNRLIGATDADVADQTLKVAVAERMIRAVNPQAEVTCIDGRVSDPISAPAIAGVDIIFGCLDRDIHRIELTEVAARHAKVYFDLASDIDPDHNEYGGRVVLCDGSRCLVCLPEMLNQTTIAVDGMNADQQDAHARIYGVRPEALRQTGPSVVSINGVVASLAVSEFVMLATGLRAPASQITYRADLPVVRLSRDESNADCYYCRGVWGSALGGVNL